MSDLGMLCLSFIAVLLYFALRRERKMTTTEWLERMRELRLGIK